jgi:hypothetical protein
MNSLKTIENFAQKHGLKLKPAKEKQSPLNINSSAKQKELLIKIATDLGYLHDEKI